jgi:hypothetical protein
MKDIILLNVHGGFPSNMIQKAFQQLQNFKCLKHSSSFYSSCYPSFANHELSFEDILVNRSRADVVNPDMPFESLFHLFKKNGYSTSLFGMVDKNVEKYEIDNFFRLNNDDDIFLKVLEYLATSDKQSKFCVINLYGILDIKHSTDSRVQAKTTIHVNNFAINTKSEEELKKIDILYRTSWEFLIKLDQFLQKLVDIVRNKLFYFFSDHPVSLMEHDKMRNAHWDSCLKTFLLVYTPEISVKEFPAPIQLSNLTNMLLENVDNNWCRKLCDDCILTSSIESENSFFRGIIPKCGRLYSICFSFQNSDLLSKVEEKQTKGKSIWINPMLNTFGEDMRRHISIFDLVEDYYEENNLSSPDFLSSPAFEYIWSKFMNSVLMHGFSVLKIKIASVLQQTLVDQTTQYSLGMTSYMSKYNTSLTRQFIEYSKHFQSAFTVFVPLDYDKSTFPSWLPKPVSGCLGSDTLQLLAKKKQSVYCQNQSYPVTYVDNEILIGEECVIVTEHSICICDEKAIKVYEVDKKSKPKKIEPESEKSIELNPAQLSTDLLKQHDTFTSVTNNVDDDKSSRQTSPKSESSVAKQKMKAKSRADFKNPVSRNNNNNLKRADSFTQQKGMAKNVELLKLKKETKR